jgi:hypothetical protein
MQICLEEGQRHEKKGKKAKRGNENSDYALKNTPFSLLPQKTKRLLVFSLNLNY